MKLVDYDGKTVLITGGTKGIGRATGLAYGRLGARVWLTYKWGSADEDELRAAFAAVGAPTPEFVQADAADNGDTKALLGRMKEQGQVPFTFISNVAVAVRGDGPMAHTKRALMKSIEYSSWPLVEYLHQMKKAFGEYPRYALATSSDGPDAHYPHYDYVAISKAVLETFVRYMATHLRDDGVVVNALRTRQVLTDSYTQIFGEGNVALAEHFRDFAVTPEQCANVILAMTSGLMDSMSGQVVLLDRGAQFVDNMMTLGARMAGAPSGSTSASTSTQENE